MSCADLKVSHKKQENKKYTATRNRPNASMTWQRDMLQLLGQRNTRRDGPAHISTPKP
jgi:hypothetical protein